MSSAFTDPKISIYLQKLEEITHQIYQWSENMKQLLINKCNIVQSQAIKSIERMKHIVQKVYKKQIENVQETKINQKKQFDRDHFDLIQNILLADKSIICYDQQLEKYFEFKEKFKQSIDSVYQQMNLTHEAKYTVLKHFIFIGDYDFDTNKISGRFFSAKKCLIFDFLILEDKLQHQIYIFNDYFQFSNTYNPFYENMLWKFKQDISDGIKQYKGQYDYE